MPCYLWCNLYGGQTVYSDRMAKLLHGNICCHVQCFFEDSTYLRGCQCLFECHNYSTEMRASLVILGPDLDRGTSG